MRRLLTVLLFSGLALLWGGTVNAHSDVALPPSSLGGGGGADGTGGTTEDTDVVYLTDPTNDLAIGGTDASAAFFFDEGTGQLFLNVPGGGLVVAAPAAEGSRITFRESSGAGSDSLSIIAPADLVGASDCILAADGTFPNSCLSAGTNLTTLTDGSDASSLHDHLTLGGGNITVNAGDLVVLRTGTDGTLRLSGDSGFWTSSLEFEDGGSDRWVVGNQLSNDNFILIDASTNQQPFRVEPGAPDEALRITSSRIELNAQVELPNATTLPATCAVGEVYFDSDATAGENVYGCTATNTWTLQGDGGGGGGGDNVAINGSGVTDPDFVSTGDIAFTDTSNTITADINADSVTAADFADGDWGDVSVSTNSVTLDSDVIDASHLADADWGDVSVASGSVTLDADVVAAAEMADADHGDVAWSGGVASVQAVQTDAIGQLTDIASSLRSGLDATLITGTATTGECAQFDVNGDIVGAGGACGSGGATTDGGAVTYVTSATDDFAVGGTDSSAALFFDEATGALSINVAGASIDVQAHATDGSSIQIKEGADDGTDTFMFRVPDSGLSGSAVCEISAGGLIPGSCIAAFNTTDECGITFASAVAEDDIMCGKATGAITLVSLDCTATGAVTPISQVVTVVECDANGGSCSSTGGSVTVSALTTNVADATFTDDSIADGNWWGIQTTSLTLAAEFLHCQVEFTR